ncbi:TPA: hypothetical protein ACGAPQ_000108 [Citrobacter farmeri]
MYWRTPCRAGKYNLPAYGRNATTSRAPCFRPAFSPNTVGRIDGAMSWGELLTKEAS